MVVSLSLTKSMSRALVIKQPHVHLLLESSSLLPGSILVSSMRAGAMPFTVMPFFAYALASQWTMPWRADLADLMNLVRKHGSGLYVVCYHQARLRLTHNAVR